MRRLFGLLVLMGLTAGSATAQVVPPDTRQVILTIPTARCSNDRTPADLIVRWAAGWVAPTPITIWRIEGEIGTDGANPATGGRFPGVDTQTSFYTSNPRFGVPWRLTFDHYTEFTGRHDRDKVFTEHDAPRLNAGDQINIGHQCNEIAGLPSHSYSTVIVTYETGWH